MNASPVPVSAIPNDVYRKLVDLIYVHSRIRLGPDKHTLLDNRLRKRLQLLGLSSYTDYCQRLRTPGDAAEIEELVDLVSTNHTAFFREPSHFSFVKDHMLPSLIPSALAAREPLRIWSAAAASGEEAYTLAMVMAEATREFADLRWELIASDISRRILMAAARGIYKTEVCAPIPAQLLRRYFQEGFGVRQGTCRVKNELRNRVRFERINLFQAKYPLTKPQHLIFCRNVMIYFDEPSREELIEKLTQSLVPGGYLVMGHSESLLRVPQGLQTVHQGVYCRL